MRLQPISMTSNAVRLRAWRHKNPEKAHAIQKRYWDKNKVKVSAWLKKARLRKARETKIWIDALKVNPCVDCDGHFPPECMDFDHVRGHKEFNVGNGKLMSQEKLQREIDKCDLVCSNCHRVRTRARKRGYIQ